LTEHQRARFQEGIELFNRGRFFECHEAWEEVWLGFSGDRKKFLQGLIQLTVAFHHLRNGNRVGAGRLLAAAVEKLVLDSPERSLIDVEGLLAEVGLVREQIIAGEPVSVRIPAPQIHWKDTQQAAK
jgi:predicted metal-dependent hydrolase